MVELSWSGVVLIIYAVTYAIIVIAVGIMVYKNRKEHHITYCEELVHQREIYGAVIVHIYDQSTDVAVMVNWGRLTVQELNGNNLEGINMLSFLIPGVFVMFLYRFITVCFALYDGGSKKKEIKMYHDTESNEKRTISSILFDILLALFDLYFIKVIYREFQQGLRKPNPTHRSLQLCESLFESMPQVVLQSVFLLRYASVNQDDMFSMTLTIFSISASLLAIANKYSWFDEQACVQSAKEMFCCKMHRFKQENQSIPFSWKFIIRSVWRWSDLCVRFIIFSLLWVCIGGFWFILYIIVSFTYYFFVVRNRIKGSFIYRILATVICEVGIILDWEIHFCVARCIDNGIMLIIISSFLLSKYKCQTGIKILCTEEQHRDINETPLLLVFLLMGWIGFGIQLITYPILQTHKFRIIKKSLLGKEFFNIILEGDDSDVATYFLTFYIENTNGCKKQEIMNFNTKKSMEDCHELGENLEEIIYPGDIAGDIAVNSKLCKPFKYGISMQIIHNIYDENGILLTGENAIKHIKQLYISDSKYYEQIIELFKIHFIVDQKREFKIKCTEKMFGFLMLNSENWMVVEKYRFGEEITKNSKFCRIIRGHDYDDLYNKNKQVLIRVIDKSENKFYQDLFNREVNNLRVLNDSNVRAKGILPLKGRDKADDAYFVVTKALNGLKFLDYMTKKELTMKTILKHIVEMFEIISFLHSKNIVHRNIALENFQFMNNNNNELVLTNYEYSKKILDNSDKIYGNISGKLLCLSPELCAEIRLRVLTHKEWRENSISGKMYKKSDIWALGVLCYFLITGKRLFYKWSRNREYNTLKTIYKIGSFTGIDSNIQPFAHEKSNEIFIDFMNKILENNYRDRMDIKQCLNHPFLSVEHIENIDQDLMIQNNIYINQLTYKKKSKLHAAILKVQISDMIEREETQNMKIEKTESQFDKFTNHKDYASMEEQFKRMDLDNDGYTTLEELTTLLTSLGYSTNYAAKQSKVIMEELDENGDGKIEFKEFAASWLQHKLDTNDKYIHAIFEVFDVNGDGVISINELKEILFKDDNDDNKEDDDVAEIDHGATLHFDREDTYVDEKLEMLEQMLDEIDEDKNGEISFEEFQKAMTTDLNGKNESNLFNRIVKDVGFKIVNEFGSDALFENEKDYDKDESVEVTMNLETYLKFED